MWKQITIATLGCLLAVSVSLGQTTQPAIEGRLDYKASRAFDRGDYQTALPLLRKLVVELADKPAKRKLVEDRIRICEKAMAAAATQPAPVDPNVLPGFDAATGKRIPHPAPKAGQVLNTSIKELGNFEYDQDKGGNIPEDVKRLTGSRIRLRGFMIPIDQSARMTQFALVPSLFSCCFGQPPQIQHTIVVTCPPNKAVELTADEVIVDGTLKVQERRDDGYVVSLFEIAATGVYAAPK